MNEKIAMRVSWVSVGVNLGLSALKLACGVLGRSGAMVSDAIHSASDVFSTLIVMVGIHISARASDREHPYGHERLECLAAILLAMVLAATGLLLGWHGLTKAGETLTVPGVTPLIAAVLSIAVKEGLFRYTRHYARLLDSEALLADAWHHRSDALSSVGALIGIAGARLGFPALDPLAAVIISVFIVKAAVDIFQDAAEKLVDHSCDEATEQALRRCILGCEGVEAVDLLLTREFGSRIYVETEISVDGDLPLRQAHDIAEKVHAGVERDFPKVKHVMVHVNPSCRRGKSESDAGL